MVELLDAVRVLGSNPTLSWSGRLDPTTPNVINCNIPPHTLIAVILSYLAPLPFAYYHSSKFHTSYLPLILIVTKVWFLLRKYISCNTREKKRFWIVVWASFEGDLPTNTVFVFCKVS